MDALDADVPLAVNRDLLIGIAPFVIGLVVVLALIGAVAYGMRLRRIGDMRRSGPPPPGPDEPKGYEEGHIGPSEMPHDGRRRLPPYDVHDTGSTETESEPVSERPKWTEGGSGGFGSGGVGHH